MSILKTLPGGKKEKKKGQGCTEGIFTEETPRRGLHHRLLPCWSRSYWLEDSEKFISCRRKINWTVLSGSNYFVLFPQEIVLLFRSWRMVEQSDRCICGQDFTKRTSPFCWQFRFFCSHQHTGVRCVKPRFLFECDYTHACNTACCTVGAI